MKLGYRRKTHPVAAVEAGFGYFADKATGLGDVGFWWQGGNLTSIYEYLPWQLSTLYLGLSDKGSDGCRSPLRVMLKVRVKSQ